MKKLKKPRKESPRPLDTKKLEEVHGGLEPPVYQPEQHNETFVRRSR